MEGLSGIVGQERALGQLTAALDAGRPHHAYLFDGPDGVGKRTTAIALAQALSCETHRGRGCGACEPCRKIDAGTHPDLILFQVVPEKGQTERVRDLQPQLAFPPHEGRARVVVLDPAHELNQQASNVLLKTLEEPPPRTHFVLCTAIPSALLITIRSRCQHVHFSPLPDEVVAARLAAAHGVSDEAAQAASQAAGGSLGRALELAATDAEGARLGRARALVAAARAQRRGEVQPLLDAAAELSGDRDEALATLELLWTTFRDAVLIAEGVDAGRVQAGRRARAAEVAARPVPLLLGGLHAIEEAREAILSYVGPQLALERLVVRLGQIGAAA
jgi:DNA polymerase-3 subunit delta'